MRATAADLPTRLARPGRLAAAAVLVAVALVARAAPAKPPPATSRAGGTAVRGAIEDDWPRALAAARSRGVPIVVDLWAPW